MFIDIHVHIRQFPAPLRKGGGVAYANPEKLIARYDELGIEKGVLLPGVVPECAIQPQSNEEVIMIAEEYPDRFIPFCNVDPRALTNSFDSPLGDLLRYYKDKGCKGVGEVTANLPFLDPMVQNLFKHCQDVDLPLTFHISWKQGYRYGLVDDPGLPQLEVCLQRFKKLKFFGHSQAFWAEMGVLKKPGDRLGYPDYPIEEEGATPRLMRRYPNLYGDLSGGSGHNSLARDLDYAVKFLNEFQDRLFYGTDICAPDTEAPLGLLLIGLRDSGKISEEVFQKVARENAIRVLGLDG